MTRNLQQTLEDLLRSGARLSPVQRVLLWQLFFEIETDRLIIVGELIDPGRSSGARLSWLLGFIIYGLASAIAVGLRVMTDAQMMLGLFCLIEMLGVVLMLGAVLGRSAHRCSVSA